MGIDRCWNLTILFSHGNAEDIGQIYNWFWEFSKKLNVNIMAYDYAGYGKSTDKKPKEKKCYKGIEAAYKFLIQCKNQKPNQIIIHGTRDEIVPFKHGQDLFLACLEKYRVKPFWV